MASATSRKLVTIISILLLCPYLGLAQEKEKLERLMDYFATNERYNGSVLVARRGSILLEKGYGYRDAAKQIKNTENSICEIGANTMQFTAELMLLIDAQGKLSLDDHVAKYMPTYPNGDKITIKNLLTHTSGIYDYTDDTVLMGHPETAIGRDSLVAKFKDKPLLCEPGERFVYSNSDYVLLGCIAEKILDRSYEWLVKQRIYNACGMSHSGFDFADLTDENKAVGYDYLLKDSVRAAAVTDSTLTFAAAGMYSTVGDLYKWHKTLEEHKLLPKDWQEIGYTPYKNHYAFGWEVVNMFQKRFLEHSGNVPGFSSFEMREENDDVFIVLLENTTRPADESRVMADNIVRCLYEKDYKIPSSKQLLAEKERVDVKNEVVEKDEEEVKAEVTEKSTEEKAPKHEHKKAITEQAEALKAYDGEYALDATFSIFISHDGNDVYARATGGDSYHMVQEHGTGFYKAGLDAKIEFVKDGNGAVSKLILHQHGRTLEGTKN